MLHAAQLKRSGLKRLALCALLGLGVASASPASDLYQSALSKLIDHYYGWSTADLSALNTKYSALLRVQCAQEGESCPYDTARTVLGDLFKEMGDAHTNVRDPEGAERLREITQDLAVRRTGARTVRVEGGLLVVTIMPGSPAERDGLRQYDLLTQVNGQDAGKRQGENAPIGPNEFIRLERAGEPIVVTRERSGQRPVTLSLTTDLLKARDVPTLTWAGADKHTALITYPSFLSRDASELFLEKVQQAQKAGAERLIVDLRFNSGGSLIECVAAASTFAPVKYKTQYRRGSYTYTGVGGQERQLFGKQDRAQGSVWKGQVAVLVGPNTASCAEVFTFYAQKAGALAVGEQTRGVGNSGVIFEPLPDGGVLAVTILRAFTADDQPLPAFITPDVSAPLDIPALIGEGRDTTLDAALDALSAAGH